MHLPINFPSDGDVIREEVGRFRALSPEDRIAYIRGIIAAGAIMMRQAPNAEFLRQYTIEQENLAQQAVKEFISRYAGTILEPRSGAYP
jgi:hypothetical protein